MPDQPGWRRSRRARGVAAVDVAVTTGIGGLLVLLFLPCVTQIRDEARLAQCLQNMNAIGRASLAYIADYDGYPIVVRQAGGYAGISNWTHVGATSSDFWRTASSGVFFIPGADRPLNTYLLGTPLEPDDVVDGAIVERTPMPLTRCPADDSSAQRSFSAGEVRFEPISAYDDVGTSYQWNLTAIQNTNMTDAQWFYQSGAAVLGRLMVRESVAYADEFVLNIEDNADVGLAESIALRGNHGELNRHVVQFRDGHAAYILMDTRQYCGPSWKAIVTQWVYERSILKDWYYPNRTQACLPTTSVKEIP